MCVQIRRATLVTEPWNAATTTITVPAHLDDEHAVQAVRTVLAALYVDQPTSGATCWCGAPISLGAPRVPTQRRSSEVMAHGA